MSFRQRLHNESPVVGTMISEVKNPNVAVMLATAGLDFMIVDMEHGTYDWSEMAAIVTTAQSSGLAPFVRIPEIRRETVLKPLDAGATGLVVPMVEHREQVEEIVHYAKYPPDGRRGVALRRAHSRYSKQPAVEYLERANQETTVLVQVESQQALDNLEDLATVPGLDGFFIGPFDLSVDLGLTAQLQHQTLWEAYERVIAVSGDHGLVTAIHLFESGLATELLQKGVRMVSLGSDVNLIVDACAENADKLRQAMQA